MAKGPSSALRSLPDFKDDAEYIVRLKRAIEYPAGSRNYITPDSLRIVLSGAVAKQYTDAIESAEVLN